MSKPVRILRATKDKDNPYKQVRRATFDGSKLSFEARGVLAYVLMKPDNWELNITDIMREGNIGRDKAYRIIDELIEQGYAERLDGRDEQGKFGHNYLMIHEEPCTEKPDTDKPHTEKPYPENTDHNNKGIPIRSESNKKGKSNEATPSPAKHPAVEAYRELHNRFPSTAQMKIIAEHDPLISNWVRAIRAWAAAGYKPTNIEGMLEWALNPNLISERENGKHRNGAYMSKGEKQMAAVDEAFRLLELKGMLDEG